MERPKPTDLFARLAGWRRLSLAALSLVLLLAAAAWAFSGFGAKRGPGDFEPGAQTIISAVVVRVVDGDTAVFRLEDGSDETVRFIGVDTPESTQRTEPYGKQAAAYTKRTLDKGMTVFLEQDVEPRDRYGRLLAYVWIAEPDEVSDDEIRTKLFNAQLLLNGFAQQMTVQPNSKYADFFTEYVREARSANKGLWNPDLAEEPASEPTGNPEAPTASVGPSAIPTVAYIGNRRSRKFHVPDCVSVSEMKPGNKIPLPSREAAIEARFIPCGKCDP